MASAFLKDLEICDNVEKSPDQKLGWVNISNPSETKWEARHLN